MLPLTLIRSHTAVGGKSRRWDYAEGGGMGSMLAPLRDELPEIGSIGRSAGSACLSGEVHSARGIQEDMRHK